MSAFLFALQYSFLADVFGFEYDFSDTVNKLIVVVNAVFAFLVILGLVNDPTTKGISDSEQALNYNKPKVTEEPDYGDGQEFTERKDIK